MRIGIEAFRIFRKNKHGMDIVALEVIKRLTISSSENTFYLFCFNDQTEYALQETEHFKIIRIPRSPSPFIEQIILPLLALRYRLDLLHSTGNTAPLFLPCKRVITLHDIIYLEKTDKLKGGTFYQRIGKAYRKFIVPHVIHKAAGLITVSRAEKKTILEHLPALQHRLHVIPNAVAGHFTPRPTGITLTSKLKYRIPKEDFIFFLGNTDPKKNTVNVLKAFFQLVTEHHSPLHLVIADLSSGRVKKLLHRYQMEDIANRIHCINYVRNEDLPDIYNLASFFVYPSLRESFGLPILEAMACGTPVITSQLPATTETAGTAALFINPLDPDELTAAMRKLEASKELRNAMRLAGLERVKKFSWTAAALQLARLYQDLLDGKTVIPGNTEAGQRPMPVNGEAPLLSS